MPSYPGGIRINLWDLFEPEIGFLISEASVPRKSLSPPAFYQTKKPQRLISAKFTQKLRTLLLPYCFELSKVSP